MAELLIPTEVREALHRAIDRICDRAGRVAVSDELDIESVFAGETIRTERGQVTIEPHALKFEPRESGMLTIRWLPEE